MNDSNIIAPAAPTRPATTNTTTPAQSEVVDINHAIPLKIREDRLRRKAAKRGLRIRKTRTEGGYLVYNPQRRQVVCSGAKYNHGTTLERVAEFLNQYSLGVPIDPTGTYYLNPALIGMACPSGDLPQKIQDDRLRCLAAKANCLIRKSRRDGTYTVIDGETEEPQNDCLIEGIGASGWDYSMAWEYFFLGEDS